MSSNSLPGHPEYPSDKRFDTLTVAEVSAWVKNLGTSSKYTEISNEISNQAVNGKIFLQLTVPDLVSSFELENDPLYAEALYTAAQQCQRKGTYSTNNNSTGSLVRTDPTVFLALSPYQLSEYLTTLITEEKLGPLHTTIKEYLLQYGIGGALLSKWILEGMPVLQTKLSNCTKKTAAITSLYSVITDYFGSTVTLTMVNESIGNGSNASSSPSLTVPSSSESRTPSTDSSVSSSTFTPVPRSITNVGPSCKDYFEFDETEGNRDHIGDGSTCRVFRCRLRPSMTNNHPFGPLPDNLCVKVYSKEILRKNPDFITKVIDREYEALANHIHPNIIRMVATFKERDPALTNRTDEYTNVYVVQELASGTPDDMSALDELSVEERKKAMQQLGGGPELYRYFVTRRPLGEDVVRYIMVQLFSPVMWLHRLAVPIIHRDIKPENAVVCGEVFVPSMKKKVPIVKLMDFGLSRTIPIETLVSQMDGSAPNTNNAATVGTVGMMTANTGSAAFMAPEVMRASAGNMARYGVSYDIYSLGVTLFVLATKSLPRGLLSRDKDAHVRAKQALSPLGLDLLARCIQEEPSKRPSARLSLCHPWFDPIRQEYYDIFKDDILLRVKQEQDQQRTTNTAGNSSASTGSSSAPTSPNNNTNV